MVACLTLAAVFASPVVPVAATTWAGRYSVWRGGAFATQYLDYSCVGATIQITLNLVQGRRDRSKRHQLTYLQYAKDHSLYPVNDLGADAQGWAEALIHWGAGNDWGPSAASSIQAALKTAAKQIRSANKPVGLLTFHGGHAWLMTGFESTADPAVTSSYAVTAVEVLGPLYPNGTFNGHSIDPGPRTWMSVATLGRRFNTYYQPGQPVWNGKWVTVIPLASQVLPVSGPGAAVGPADLPDLGSVFGWNWMLGRLALQDMIGRP